MREAHANPSVILPASASDAYCACGEWSKAISTYARLLSGATVLRLAVGDSDDAVAGSHKDPPPTAFEYDDDRHPSNPFISSHIDALNNLGNALRGAGRLTEAARSYVLVCQQVPPVVLDFNGVTISLLTLCIEVGIGMLN